MSTLKLMQWNMKITYSWLKDISFSHTSLKMRSHSKERIKHEYEYQRNWANLPNADVIVVNCFLIGSLSWEKYARCEAQQQQTGAKDAVLEYYRRKYRYIYLSILSQPMSDLKSPLLLCLMEAITIFEPRQARIFCAKAASSVPCMGSMAPSLRLISDLERLQRQSLVMGGLRAR